MDQIKVIPKDLLCIIPKFEGDEAQLNFFLRKCQYIYDAFSDDNPTQETYLFHAISSRLVGRAATLLGVREDIDNWEDLKKTLIQHFGDSRSEENIALELEQMRIRPGESYTDFLRRIQITKSMLMSKVNLGDQNVKATKNSMYNSLAFNTFIYNLSEDLLQMVRMKKCTDLDSALVVVNEEVNFKNQYNARRQGSTQQWNTSSYPHATFRPAQNTTKPLVFGSQNSGFNCSQGPQTKALFGVPQTFGSKPTTRSGFATFGQAQTVSVFSTKPIPKETETNPAVLPKTESDSAT